MSNMRIHRRSFKQAKPRFWVSDTWHWLVERNHARRTLTCPECGTSVDIVDRSVGSIHYYAADLRSRNCRRNCSEYVSLLIRMDAKQIGRDMSNRSICKAQHNHRMQGSGGGQRIMKSTSYSRRPVMLVVIPQQSTYCCSSNQKKIA